MSSRPTTPTRELLQSSAQPPSSETHLLFATGSSHEGEWEGPAEAAVSPLERQHVQPSSFFMFRRSKSFFFFFRSRRSQCFGSDNLNPGLVQKILNSFQSSGSFVELLVTMQLNQTLGASPFFLRRCQLISCRQRVRLYICVNKVTTVFCVLFVLLFPTLSLNMSLFNPASGSC